MIANVVEKATRPGRLTKAMPARGRGGGDAAEEKPKDDNGDAEGTGNPYQKLSRNHTSELRDRQNLSLYCPPYGTGK